MLPDLRVVTIAVISTFLFAVSVGFYTSSRLMSDRKPRGDSLAAIEDHPLNRIALNWPEPVQPPSDSLNLDFAVTAKVQRNPVREVSEEPANARAKIAAAPQEANRDVRAEQPVVDAPKVVAAKIEPPTIESQKIEPAKIEPAKIEPARIEVPKLELPQVEAPKVVPQKVELPTVETVAPPPLARAPAAKPEDNLPTATIAQPPAVNSGSDDPKRQPDAEAGPAANVAALPEASEPDAEAGLEVGTETEAEAQQAIPAKKKVRKAKKRAAKKVAKPAPRPKLRPAVTQAANPWAFPFTGFQNQQGFQTQGFQTR